MYVLLHNMSFHFLGFEFNMNGWHFYVLLTCFYDRHCFPCFCVPCNSVTSTLGVMHHDVFGRATLDGVFEGAPLFFSIPAKTAATIRVSWSFSGIRCMDESLLVCKARASSNAEKGKPFPTGCIPSAFPLAMNKDRCFSWPPNFWHCCQCPSKKADCSMKRH